MTRPPRATRRPRIAPASPSSSAPSPPRRTPPRTAAANSPYGPPSLNVASAAGIRGARRWWQNGHACRSTPSASPPSDSRGAQRRTKAAAAAKVLNSHVRPELNCAPARPAGPRGRAGDLEADTDGPARAVAVGERDRGRAVRAALDEQRVARPSRTTSSRPPSRWRSVRACTRHGASPAARASRLVQIPPATRQIPWRTAAATAVASGGGDPTAAAPATIAPTTARRATYSAEAGRRRGVGEAQPTA